GSSQGAGLERRQGLKGAEPRAQGRWVRLERRATLGSQISPEALEETPRQPRPRLGCEAWLAREEVTEERRRRTRHLKGCFCRRQRRRGLGHPVVVEGDLLLAQEERPRGQIA